MFRLTKALKSYREAGPLNEQINLLGFIDDHVFLTKSGDLGVVLSVSGVDYEGWTETRLTSTPNAWRQRSKSSTTSAAFTSTSSSARIHGFLIASTQTRW